MRSQQGFTILEILIAIVISGILATMVFFTFQAQQNSYIGQNMLARTDASLRQSMNFIGRELINAGHGMNINGHSLGADGFDGLDDSPLIFLQHWNSGAPGAPDALSVTYMDTDSENWFMVNYTGSDMTSQATPCNTTALPVRDLAEHQAAAASVEPGSTIICFTPIGRNFGTNGNGGTASFSFRVTGAFGGADLPVASNAGIGGIDNFGGICTQSLPEMVCAPKVRRSFYVDTTDNGVGPGSPDNPVLMMADRDDFDFFAAPEDPTDIPIAYGIEDIQLDVCLAGSDCRATGIWDTGLFPDFSALNMTNATSVAVRIGARSRRPDPSGGLKLPKLTLDASGGAYGAAIPTIPGEESYYRRQATVEIHLRNARGAFLVSSLGQGGAAVAAGTGP